uniref:Uncharacterized protein n=1 Tax=Oryza punctata TaxID=4537 RepID=A0A1V1H7Q6_ORYPU|nr:hypothetical protein [Oryza punctata]
MDNDQINWHALESKVRTCARVKQISQACVCFFASTRGNVTRDCSVTKRRGGDGDWRKRKSGHLQNRRSLRLVARVATGGGRVSLGVRGQGSIEGRRSPCLAARAVAGGNRASSGVEGPRRGAWRRYDVNVVKALLGAEGRGVVKGLRLPRFGVRMTASIGEDDKGDSGEKGIYSEDGSHGTQLQISRL